LTLQYLPFKIFYTFEVKPKMSNKLLNIIISPFFIALILATIFIILLPPIFNKYKIEIDSSNLVSGKNDFLGYFSDLDNDGLSELIQFKINKVGNGAFTIRDYKLKTIDQWNLPGKSIIGGRSFIVGDWDNNKLKEIYTFYYRNDSLFLAWCEPLSSKDSQMHYKFVDRIHLADGVPDFECYFKAIHDLNNDGIKHILFSIYGRFSLQPRNIYVYNPALHTIIKSPKSYSYAGITSIADIDGDGLEEIFTSTRSNGNVPQKAGYPFHDSSAWVFIFNPDLSFKFAPIEIPGTQITVSNYPLLSSHGNHIFTLIKYLNSASDKAYEVRIFDDHFHPVKTIVMDTTSENIDTRWNQLFFNRNDYIINQNTRTIKRFDDDKLIFSDIKNNMPENRTKFDTIDIDRDGLDELVNWNTDGVTIFRDQFKDPVTLVIPLDFDHNYNSISRYSDKSGLNKFYLQQGKSDYLISYEANPLYYLKYPSWLGIYIVCLVFVFLIRKLQQYQLNQKQKITDQITGLQLRTLKSQFDPHFTFNVINSISYAVHKTDKETANKYISELSDFVRNIVTDSEKIARPLNEELKIVANYLEIEKLRFRDRFTFKVNVSKENIPSIQIPKNLILTFAENAVKHGIRPMKQSGLITISVKHAQQSTTIVVEDNGVGRSAEKKEDNTGKGLGIIQQILELYFQLKKVKITYEIVDKMDDGKPSGTKVVISIPE